MRNMFLLADFSKQQQPLITATNFFGQQEHADLLMTSHCDFNSVSIFELNHALEYIC